MTTAPPLLQRFRLNHLGGAVVAISPLFTTASSGQTVAVIWSTTCCVKSENFATGITFSSGSFAHSLILSNGAADVIGTQIIFALLLSFSAAAAVPCLSA